MSLHLELGPKKLSIKTPPGRLLSEVLAEFCTKYDMKPEEYGLQHNKKNLDLSLTFRLSGLPQNCKLDVIRRAKPAGMCGLFRFPLFFLILFGLHIVSNWFIVSFGVFIQVMDFSWRRRRLGDAKFVAAS
jgi:hypothetical protein